MLKLDDGDGIQCREDMLSSPDTIYYFSELLNMKPREPLLGPRHNGQPTFNRFSEIPPKGSHLFTTEVRRLATLIAASHKTSLPFSSMRGIQVQMQTEEEVQ
ncbi:hypothetical protein E4U59_003061 [Claviceps monticola]|nr:hypothetical protein E4U59_003061 [Claviceps monticola]